MDFLAEEWIEARAVARSYALQRLPALSPEACQIVEALIERLSALPLPGTPSVLAERRWQWQGFETLVKAVTYADRVSNSPKSQWMGVLERVHELCDEPLPTDLESLAQLRAEFSTVYSEVETALR